MFDCIKIVAKTVLLILESLEKGADSLVLFDKPLLAGRCSATHFKLLELDL